MPAVSYLEFGGGVDRRLPPNVQSADKLYVLRNAYITTGKKIRKRPALRSLGDMVGSIGLAGLDGELKAFVERGGGTFFPPVVPGVTVSSIQLDLPPTATSTLSGIRYAQNFQ